MRSDRDEAMSRHPSSGVAVIDELNETRESPYRLFLEALEELSMVISLYGTGSIEAAESRAHVRRARELAADAWRRQNVAA